MFGTFLQVWGGGFYLLNKVFFSFAEKSQARRKRFWRIWAWAVYLAGLPAWVYILASERDWMVAAVELGSAPAMALGLIIAIRGLGKEPKWLDYFARTFAVLGFCFSLYDFGGITALSQLLEIGVVVGFLAGTYLLAKQRAFGYVFFMLMNGSNAALMYHQDKYFLALQQVISLGVVVYAYISSKRKL